MPWYVNTRSWKRTRYHLVEQAGGPALCGWMMLPWYQELPDPVVKEWKVCWGCMSASTFDDVAVRHGTNAISLR